MDQFGITTFWHYRIDATGSFYYTGNDPDSAHHFFHNGLHLSNPFFTHPSFFRQAKIFTSRIKNLGYQRGRNLLKQENNLYYHFLVVRKPSEDICEGFGFASKRIDNCLKQLAYESPEDFDSFIDYYLLETQTARNQLLDNRVLTKFSMT